MSEDRVGAAVAAEVLLAAGARTELLRSMVEVARAIFDAQATSIALLDEQGGDFVFEAATGAGSERLAGERFGAGQGIAGVAAQTGEPVVIDDLSGDPRFARQVAEGTGYVPRAIMVAPLLHGERVLGVLSVLDRGRTSRSTLQELDLLVQFATQAALAVHLDEAARHAARTLQDHGVQATTPLAGLARRLELLSPPRQHAAERLLAALDELLAG